MMIKEEKKEMEVKTAQQCKSGSENRKVQEMKMEDGEEIQKRGSEMRRELCLFYSVRSRSRPGKLRSASGK